MMTRTKVDISESGAIASLGKVNGRASGVMCDNMPDEDPAHAPAEYAEIEEEGTLVECLINTTLHEMITAARQAPDIMLVDE